MLKKSILFYFSKAIKKARVPSILGSQIDKKSKICSGSLLYYSRVERYSYVGNDCAIVNASIGAFCSIADNCIIGAAQHPYHWVSTSPVFIKGKNVLRVNFADNEFDSSKHTFIGNDVWIGNNCLIKSGVTIQDGAVVGMGSVVTKNIGPYEIWAGNPAKFIKKRFDESTIKILCESSWWNWNEERLKKFGKCFNNVEEFMKEIKA